MNIRDQCLRAKVPFFFKHLDTSLKTNPIPYRFPYILLRMLHRAA